jgi:phosphoribosylanthranilate isomerase
MALTTFVKISGVNNLSDARYCAGMEANILGFCLESGKPGYVSPEAFKEITNWVAGIQFAGEFYQADVETIKTALEHYAIDWVEVGSIETFRAIAGWGKPTILRLDAAGLASWQETEAKEKHLPTYILLEEENATALKALPIVTQVPLILGSGISLENAAAIASSKVYSGIALRGGNEIRPGLRDFDEMADILEALEIDN